VLLVAVGICFAASIPWYRTGGAPAATWLGLPDWVTVALVCYAAAAVFNAAAWLLTEVRDETEDGSGPP